ncbi:MAG: alpha/beta-type small acid-soluble spore protein [Acetobacteraceae bacterium]|nr:alpha/beta-type small acid-soluble spore protein [Acetobacteraceae bacterium]
MAARRRRHVLPEAESALDDVKYEVARDLDLDDDIRRRGWENMTTREAGKVGGHMVKRMIRFAESRLAEQARRREGEAQPEQASRKQRQR